LRISRNLAHDTHVRERLKLLSVTKLSILRFTGREANVCRGLCHVTPSIPAFRHARAGPASGSTVFTFEVMENEFVLFAKGPKPQNATRFRVYRNCSNFVGLSADTGGSSFSISALSQVGERISLFVTPQSGQKLRSPVYKSLRWREVPFFFLKSRKESEVSPGIQLRILHSNRSQIQFPSEGELEAFDVRYGDFSA
jgi:hypothetical protein